MSVQIYISPFTEHQAVSRFDYDVRDADTGAVVTSETGAAAKTITVPLRRVYQVTLSNMAELPGVRHFARIPEDGDAADGETYYANPTLKATGEAAVVTTRIPPAKGPVNVMIVRVFYPDKKPVLGATILVRMPDETDVVRGITSSAFPLAGTAVISVPRKPLYYLEVQVPGYPAAKPVLTGKPLMQYDVTMTLEPVPPRLYEDRGLPTIAYIGLGLVGLIVLSSLLGSQK